MAQCSNEKGSFLTIAHLVSVINNEGGITWSSHQVVFFLYFLSLRSALFIMPRIRNATFPQSRHRAGSPDGHLEQNNRSVFSLVRHDTSRSRCLSLDGTGGDEVHPDLLDAMFAGLTRFERSGR